MDQIIHVLGSGLAFCGFSKEPPAQWPEGHTFVPAGQSDNATCAGCKEVAEAIWQENKRKIAAQGC